MGDQHSASLADRVEDELRRGIGHGAWQPGELLPSEGELAARFEVSRTVVREAMSRLRAAGLVETRRGRGSFVLTRPAAQDFAHSLGTVRSLHDRLQLLELRRGIEVEAAALAAARRTPATLAAVDAALRRMAAVRGSASDAVEADFAFHHAIAVAAANRFYLDLLDTLGAGAITRPYAAGPAPGHLDKVFDEHRRIRDAIFAGDALSAAAAMRTHLDASRARLTG
ncbi:FadR family transcriptional regulator [Nonomuraea terrae]|uniref:FadR family transcriptional regulator n=1 Tax=Nonomuraea terrae TaxID=2530383 RepID=A0A4R4Z7D3_9ACTN|nr:FadR/GntR family transcriptional regulator [Nonomuraea terrae]TDD54098.1 FadR family transcriptional regulator [Nonomuraea terrae]